MGSEVRATVEARPSAFIIIRVHSDKSNSDFEVEVNKEEEQDLSIKEYKNTYAITSFKGNLKNTRSKKYFEYSFTDEDYTLLSVSPYLKPDQVFLLKNSAFVNPQDAVVLRLHLPNLSKPKPLTKLQPASFIRTKK